MFTEPVKIFTFVFAACLSQLLQAVLLDLDTKNILLTQSKEERFLFGQVMKETCQGLLPKDSLCRKEDRLTGK